MSDETTKREETPTQTGNAAALREALDALLAWCEAHTGACAIRVAPVPDDEAAVWAERKRAMESARAALAAPPRNCDRFATAADAMDEFHKIGCPNDCGDCPFEEYASEGNSEYCEVNWLLATSAQEGGTP